LAEHGDWATIDNVASDDAYIKSPVLTGIERRELFIWRIKARCAKENVKQARAALDELKTPGINVEIAVPDHDAYVPLIELLVKQGESNEAELLLQDAAKYGLDRHDVRFYNAFIAGYAKDFDRAVAYVVVSFFFFKKKKRTHNYL